MRFRFGKYKGYRIDHVSVTDPRYVYWCINNIKSFKISSEIKDFVNEQLVKWKNY